MVQMAPPDYKQGNPMEKSLLFRATSYKNNPKAVGAQVHLGRVFQKQIRTIGHRH